MRPEIPKLLKSLQLLKPYRKGIDTLCKPYRNNKNKNENQIKNEKEKKNQMKIERENQNGASAASKFQRVVDAEHDAPHQHFDTFVAA